MKGWATLKQSIKKECNCEYQKKQCSWHRKRCDVKIPKFNFFRAVHNNIIYLILFIFNKCKNLSLKKDANSFNKYLLPN